MHDQGNTSKQMKLVTLQIISEVMGLGNSGKSTFILCELKHTEILFALQ